MLKATILPPLRRTAADAEAFARVVHEGQVDLAGRPYVEHLGRVAERSLQIAGPHAFRPDRLAQIAWLHDVLEPDARPRGHVWPRDLQNEGFDIDVIMRVECLCTQMKGLPYRKKIELICAQAFNLNEDCLVIVKLADVEDNSDPGRLALLDPKKRAWAERRYLPAKDRLRAAIRQREEGDDV